MAFRPDRYNITINAGATWRDIFTLYTTDENSTPVDLTGYSASLIVKDKPGGTTLLTMTTGNGGIALGGNAGTITLIQSAATTAAYTFTFAPYALTITAGGGDTSEILYGDLTVVPW